jgi:hypothetical protein
LGLAIRRPSVLLIRKDTDMVIFILAFNIARGYV